MLLPSKIGITSPKIWITLKYSTRYNEKFVELFTLKLLWT